MAYEGETLEGFNFNLGRDLSRPYNNHPKGSPSIVGTPYIMTVTMLFVLGGIRVRDH